MNRDFTRVLVVGVGALGLPFAELAVQQGAQLFLVDPDRVEAKNIALNQLYGADQVGLPKVFAAADLIARRKPDASGRALRVDVRALGVGFVLGHAIDLVVCAADNRAAELHCARLAHLAGASFLRLAADAESRVVDVTHAPSARDGGSVPCGVCTYTLADHRLAEQRRSCTGEIVPAESGSALLEQGRLAASLALMLLRDGGAGVGRVLRFRGAPLLEVSTSTFVRAACCRVPHGCLEWEQVPDDVTLGSVVAKARKKLGERADLLVETDVPLCLQRTCAACGAELGPAFMRYDAQLCCGCGGAVVQDVLPPRRVLDAQSLAPFATTEIAALAPPAGIGLLFGTHGTRAGFHVTNAEAAFYSRASRHE